MSQRLLLIARSLLIGCLLLQLLGADKPVDVNTAPERQIAALPGVGAALAKQIVAARPYASLEDLKRSGISASLLKQLISKIVISRIQNETPGGQAGWITQVQPASTGPARPRVFTAQADSLPPSGPRSLFRKRVAILDFDYSTVRADSSAMLGSDVDIGKDVAGLLAKRLGDDAQYIVVECKSVDHLLAEQALSNTDRTDSAWAARIGKILGVDAVITGSITAFGREHKSTSSASSTSAGALTRLGGFYTKHASKAVVELNARVVNVETGEILTVARGDGEATRESSALSSGGALAGSGGVNMSSEGFASTILGEATTAAVAKIVATLDRTAPEIPSPAPPPVDGLVVEVNGATVILNVGSAQGLKVGDRLTVWRNAPVVSDPAAAQALANAGAALGEITITQLDRASATASYAGQERPRVGDRVKR